MSAEDAASGKVKVTRAGWIHGACGGGERHRRQRHEPPRAIHVRHCTLPVGERAQIDEGLGKALSRGTISLIAPNDLIKQSYETRTIDGVEIEFHLVPGSEAPAEMLMYFPQFKLLDMAEDATHNMHNLYTLRGAEIRDGRRWSRYIDEAIERYGDRTDAVIAQHHWPMWGNRAHRRVPEEAARPLQVHPRPDRAAAQSRPDADRDRGESCKLPASLAGEWSARGYYGTLSHNAKAVYQFYLGWYDANPADLNPLPRVEAARKQVEYMGGAKRC